MRPLTNEQLRAHKVPSEGFWELGYLVDGYDRQSLARKHWWLAVPAWGRDGWNLGSWPLVTIYTREAPDGFYLAENVEGDVTTYRFDMIEERDAATDALAFFHWKWASEEWVDGIDSAQDMPDHLRGPYSRARTEAAS
jgi:hypothetical protein